MLQDIKSPGFRQLLDDRYSWPTSYTFKFIVPHHKVDEIKEAVGEHGEHTHKPSKNGKFISITVVREMDSSEEVIAVYEKASVVDGVFSL